MVQRMQDNVLQRIPPIQAPVADYGQDMGQHGGFQAVLARFSQRVLRISPQRLIYFIRNNMAKKELCPIRILLVFVIKREKSA